MALKSIMYSFILVASMPVTKAQGGGIGGGMVGAFLALTRIEGTLFCTPNGNIGGYGEPSPVFPNAKMELQCNGNVISSAKTSASGSFSMEVNPVQMMISSILSDCVLVLKTPLATCNSKLPSAGDLISPLMIIGKTLLGTFLKPAGFQPPMPLPSSSSPRDQMRH